MILSPAVVLMALGSSWRSALWMVGIAGCLLILPFAALVVREPREGEGPEAHEMPAADASPAGGQDLDLSRALRTRSFWILAAALFCFFFYFVAMIDHLILFLTDLGFTRLQATGYFSFAVGLGIVGKLGFGLVADRVSHRTALLAEFGLLTLSSLVLLTLPASGLLLVFVVSYGIAVAARDVVYPLIVADCFGVGHLAEIYGVLMLALLPGGVLGPVFAGWVYDRLGNYDAAFALFAILNGLSLLALRLVRVETGRSTRSTAGEQT